MSYANNKLLRNISFYVIWLTRIKFTIDKAAIAEPTEEAVETRTPEQIEQEAIAACSIENGEDCEACGS